MGIASVAVYSDNDRDALHVEMADEAINIGPPPASTSYLVIERILEAVRATSAEAVHPGYGFLSERAEFANALSEAGIVFIGPNTAAIAAMGDKIESKKLAADAGVATVPGHLGTIDSPEQAVAIAGDIGFPVMIKASAGGGGKGMRIAYSVDEVREGFVRARSEAKSSFGDDRVFVERFVENPRHIEMQVLADKHGNVVHLGERECSVQRRNQKIIEEAPSLAVDPKLRDDMGRQAVALAKAVGYDSAGTVEFVFGGDDQQFYFLEMNTRLQVEHPVTELITGIDIVEQMIRVAAGEELSLRQDSVQFGGWSIETRLYAEDPFRNFLPSIGRLNTLLWPRQGTAGGETVRIDTGVVEGSEVSIHFDPLIAKMVTHAGDRDAAIDAMAAALDGVVVEGLNHNQPFLSAVMDHPRWRRGELSTSFIQQEFPDGFDGVEPDEELLRRLALIALFIHLDGLHRLAALDGRIGSGVDRLRDNWVVAFGQTEVPLNVRAVTPGSPLAVDVDWERDNRVVSAVSDWRPGNQIWSGTIDDSPITVQVRHATASTRLFVQRGRCHGARDVSRNCRSRRSNAGQGRNRHVEISSLSDARARRRHQC